MKTGIIHSLPLTVILFVLACTRHTCFPEFEDAYPAFEYPGDKPGIFSPAAICTGLNERDITISPDGKEIFYGLSTGRMVTIMHTLFDGKSWKEPEVASFASDRRFSFFEPCFAPDGNSVYFLTTMPADGRQPQQGWAYQNIFVSDRTDEGSWGLPYSPAGCINEGTLQFYPSVTRNRTLYFCRTDPGTGKHALYRSALVDNSYSECIRLPEPVNSDTVIPFNVFVSPDESFMIACISSISVAWNPDRSNYFLFAGNDDGSWTGPVPFGPEINIPGSNAMSSSLSPDGKYFFFAAQVSMPLKSDRKGRTTLSRIVKAASAAQNGNYDIYWVDAGIVRNLAEILKRTGERKTPEPGK
jgi:hypothetical protein